MTAPIVAAYLAVVGAALGSFADAMVWRLHPSLHPSRHTRLHTSPHTGRSVVTGRSECESCHHRLAGRDLVPVVSWVLLRGRCRYCGARISPTTVVLEAALGGAFVLSYLGWERGVAALVVWLAILVVLAVLVLYDLRWMTLPNRILLLLVPLTLLEAGPHPGQIVLGAAALGGPYAVLHFVSRGQWAGLGDAKLGAALGPVLGWDKGLLALCMANVLGVLVAVPALVTGRLNRKSRLPMAPFLAAGFFLAGLLVS